MKEQELFQAGVSTLVSYNDKVIEPVEPQPSSENAGTEIKLRSIHSICLADCSIPE